MTQTQQPATVSRAAFRIARSGPSTGSWVALVVVLAGLFGMHGLAGHGSHAAEMGMGDSVVTMPTTSVSGMAATGGVNGHGAGAALTTHVGSHTHAPAAGSTFGVPGAVSGAMSGGAMSVLCLAVLTAGALLLLLLLGTRRPRVAMARTPAPTPSTFLRVGRERDPPSLAALSIRRC
jgi:hypothetical protein